MKKYLFPILLVISTKLVGINYYVSPIGSDGNSGLNANAAFFTLQHAADKTAAGDTVFILPGTYVNSYPQSNILNIYNSGTASKKIVYKNYSANLPILKLSSNNWSGIDIQGADYIVIDGINVIGNNDSITLAYAQSQKNNTSNPATSANGIGITREYNNEQNRPHHNTVRNCIISKCGGGGIYTYWADYTTIENNTVSECGWYSPYGNSGISMYQNWNSDSTTGIKNYITGNTCYRNENYVPFFVQGIITDGNGIIIDDGRNTQNNSPLGVYVGKTYIANNLVLNNGGRGIHVYSSDKVTIVNNTCYHNCQSPAIKDGDFTAYDSDAVSFINNIASSLANIPPLDNGTSTNLMADHNLWDTNSGNAKPFGTNTVVGNANFILPSTNSVIANLRLQSNSAAINKGTRNLAPLIDKDNLLRLSTDSVDIGCYEFKIKTATNNSTATDNFLNVFPNPASCYINFNGDNPNSNIRDVKIFNLGGQELKAKMTSFSASHFQIDISDLPEGNYYIKIETTENSAIFTKFMKIK